MSLEEFIANLTTKDLKLIKKEIEKVQEDSQQHYRFSSIKDKDLKRLVDIEESLDRTAFDEWFSYKVTLDESIILFLEALIRDNELLIRSYKEEDLKIYFISPLLNSINFKSFKYKVRGFYEAKIAYSTEKFSFSGTTDFLVSNGLLESKQPLFFIQEFKKSEEFSNPRPQLLAELISGVELNNWRLIKGAYIVGSIWNFVILEKLDKDKYQYFISQNFDSTKIGDLQDIYRHLLFIKNEIFSYLRELND